MESLNFGALIGGLMGGVIGGLSVLVFGLTTSGKQCPDCGEALPRLRMPANWRQTLWGGNTCARCRCEVDRRGQKVERV